MPSQPIKSATNSRQLRRLDRTRDYGTVSGGGDAGEAVSFEQDGLQFNAMGVEIPAAAQES